MSDEVAKCTAERQKNRVTLKDFRKIKTFRSP